jgi:hypothetical protein
MQRRARKRQTTILLQIEVYRSRPGGKLFPVALIIRNSYGLSLTPPELFGFGEHVATDAAIGAAVHDLKQQVERWYSQPGMQPLTLTWLPDLDCSDEPPGLKQHALTMEQRRKGIHPCR